MKVFGAKDRGEDGLQKIILLNFLTRLMSVDIYSFLSRGRMMMMSMKITMKMTMMMMMMMMMMMINL